MIQNIELRRITQNIDEAECRMRGKGGELRGETDVRCVRKSKKEAEMHERKKKQYSLVEHS